MNERILTVINKNPDQQTVELTLPAIYKVTKAINLVDGKNFEIKNNKLDINIGGIEYMVLQIK
jgi:hypothetical protein